MREQTLEDYDHQVNSFFLKHTALLVRRHHRTIRRWLQQGKAVAHKSALDGAWYFHIDEINRLRRELCYPEITAEEALQMLIAIES